MHAADGVSWESLQLPSSVKIVSWAPQNDVLGHPAVKLFVTQAGINSLYEAIYHAKPVVSVPLIADQPVNAQMVGCFASHVMCLLCLCGLFAWPRCNISEVAKVSSNHTN